MARGRTANTEQVVLKLCQTEVLTSPGKKSIAGLQGSGDLRAAQG